MKIVGLLLNTHVLECPLKWEYHLITIQASFLCMYVMNILDDYYLHQLY